MSEATAVLEVRNVCGTAGVGSGGCADSVGWQGSGPGDSKGERRDSVSEGIFVGLLATGFAVRWWEQVEGRGEFDLAS